MPLARPSRESIMTALANQIGAVSSFANFLAVPGVDVRRLKPWSQVAEQPAFFLRNVKDEYAHKANILAALTLHVELWIYAKVGPDDAAAETLNTLMDAVDAALQPDNLAMNTLTLGGLVQHCWIEGDAEYDPGDLDRQAKAVIPIRILVP